MTPMSYGQLGDRGLVKAFQTRFSIAPDFSLSLMPEITGTLNLEAPELRYPAGYRGYIRGGTQGAIAAQFGRLQIRAAVADIVVTVLSLELVSGAAFSYGVTVGGFPDLATAQRGVRLDWRQPVLGNSTAIVSTDTNAAGVATTEYGAGNVAANTPAQIIKRPILLWSVNDALILSIAPVNQAFSYTVVWEERLIQEQEDTL